MAVFKNIKSTIWAVFHFTLLLMLLFFAVSFSDSQHSLRIELQNGVFDQFNKWHPREATQNVVIVDIDELSLQEVGQWPWPRSVMAELTNSLTEVGAKVIAFDGVFAEEDRSSPLYFLSHLPQEKAKKIIGIFEEDQQSYNYDEIFSQSIKKSKIFVTAFTYGRAERNSSSPLDKKRLLARSDVKQVFQDNASYFEAAAVNLPIFSKKAAGNGSFMAKPDADGVLRRAGLIFTDHETLYPSLSLEALRVFLAGRKGMSRLAAVPESERGEIDTNYRILVGDKVIPVESDGVVNVYYRYFCNAQDIKNAPHRCPNAESDYISAYKLLSPSHAQEMQDKVNGKIVLIGASAEGLKDLRSTPLRPFRPGVEVHANVIEQVLSGEYLLRPAVTKGVEAIFILGTGLFFILLSPFIGVIISVILCGGLVGLSMFGAYMVYVEYGILLDPIYPSIAVVAIFVASTILSYARAENRRKQIRNAFGMYVAPDVMSDLEANPDKLKLGGENREITIMFTDIRKFTSISEGMSPEELIQLMNKFLTGMTDIVLDHEGTVDKYIGDAMMAFWNAPRDVDGHERKACIAAIQMQSKLDTVNEWLQQRVKGKGKEPVLLRAGIGLNTGACAVGNMGSKQRFAYSALGDAVNLAARLEGQTKYYGVPIAIGEGTYQKVTDFAALEIDLIQVVGRTQATRVYALFGDDVMAQTAAFKGWMDVHMQMLAAYREQNFDKATSLLNACSEKSEGRGTVLYDLYAQRIAALKTQDLPEDWGGVYISKQK